MHFTQIVDEICNNAEKIAKDKVICDRLNKQIQFFLEKNGIANTQNDIELQQLISQKNEMFASILQQSEAIKENTCFKALKDMPYDIIIGKQEMMPKLFKGIKKLQQQHQILADTTYNYQLLLINLKNYLYLKTLTKDFIYSLLEYFLNEVTTIIRENTTYKNNHFVLSDIKNKNSNTLIEQVSTLHLNYKELSPSILLERIADLLRSFQNEIKNSSISDHLLQPLSSLQQKEYFKKLSYLVNELPKIFTTTKQMTSDDKWNYDKLKKEIQQLSHKQFPSVSKSSFFSCCFKNNEENEEHQKLLSNNKTYA